MVDTKKEQERDELHRAIWAIADELRGAVDGWDFKNYVLGTMFYRYISENLTSYINSGEAEAGNTGFDYAEMPDEEAEEAREGLLEEKSDNKVLFIDATNECIKVTNNNKLTQDNIRRIVDTFAGREEIAHFAHLANYDEIAQNDYNLSVSTYVEAEDTREKIDIVKLNAEIREIVAREQVLRDEIDKIIAEIEGGQTSEQ